MISVEGIVAISFLLVVWYVLSSVGNEDDLEYKRVECYDKSVYRCGKCNKKCKWNMLVRAVEEDREDL